MVCWQRRLALVTLALAATVKCQGEPPSASPSNLTYDRDSFGAGTYDDSRSYDRTYGDISFDGLPLAPPAVEGNVCQPNQTTGYSMYHNCPVESVFCDEYGHTCFGLARSISSAGAPDLRPNFQTCLPSAGSDNGRPVPCGTGSMCSSCVVSGSRCTCSSSNTDIPFPPLPPPPPPPAPGRPRPSPPPYIFADEHLTVVSGPCVVSGQCVHSAHYPKHYGNGERCTLRPVRGQPLRVEAFSTEEGYDYLTINGVGYSGSELITLSRNSIPNSIAQKIIPDRDIFWSSDGSESMSGWLICQESDHQPHMPPWPPHVPPSPPSPPSPPASPPPPLSPPLSELFLGCLRLEDSFVAMLRNGTTLPEALGQGDSDVESIAECHATCAGRASRYFRTFANAEYRELMCECANVSHAISGGG